MQRYTHPDPLLDAAHQPGDVFPRALVVADDPLVRGGFSALLADSAAGESAIDDASQAASSSGANVVLWDLGPSDATQSADFGSLVAAVDVPVIALGPPGTRALTWLGKGAAAVMRRDADEATLRAAIDSVLHGLTVIEPTLLEPDLESHASTQELPEGEAMTPRETEVLELMASGLSNRKIADRLGISTHTAKFHIGAILAKLDADTRTEAVVKAVQRGLVML